MLYVGVDPDMHNMPLAIVDAEGMPQYLYIAKVKKKIVKEAAVVAMAEAFTSLPCFHPEEGVDMDQINGIAVEGQKIYTGVHRGEKKTQNTHAIKSLAAVAGVALGVLTSMCSLADTFYVLPQDWKGQVPKQTAQARICSYLGWPYRTVGSREDGYVVPNVKQWAGCFSDNEWKQIMDAIGLARWCAAECKDRDIAEAVKARGTTEGVVTG